jgi:hypothetical protein
MTLPALIIRKFLVASLAVVGVAVAATGPQKAQNSAAADVPRWKMDLRYYGFPDKGSSSARVPEPYAFRSVFFLDENTVVFTFLTKEADPGLQRRDDPNFVPRYMLRAAVFDAASGGLQKLLEWKSSDYNVGVIGRSDGKLVLFSLGKVSLLARDGELLDESPELEISLPRAVLRDIYVSPSGKTVLVAFANDKESECNRLNTDKMLWVKEKCEAVTAGAISDSEMAGMGRAAFGSHAPQVWIHEFEGPWRMLCESLKGCGSPLFVNDQTVLLYNAAELSLAGNKGDIRWHQEVMSYWEWSAILPRPLCISANGIRVAVLANSSLVGIQKSRSALENDIQPDGILVFDVPGHQPIYELRNSKSTLRRKMTIALSTSGSRLATETDGVVRVYDLPPSGAIPAPH